MQYLPALLTLAAAASAIDIRLHTDLHCNTVGVWAYCTNWGPNSCCGVDDAAYLSVAFVAIPTNWNVETRAYTGGFCKNQRIVDSPEHANTVCLHDQDGVARMTGGGYGFTNRKSTLGASSPDECRPDGLVLEDGTNYATLASDMDQNLYSELVRLCLPCREEYLLTISQ